MSISFLHSRYSQTSMSVLKTAKTVLSVDRNYFWLRSDITVNEIELTMNSLIVRMGPQHFSVLWHQTGESE